MQPPEHNFITLTPFRYQGDALLKLNAHAAAQEVLIILASVSETYFIPDILCHTFRCTSAFWKWTAMNGRFCAPCCRQFGNFCHSNA